MDIKRAAFSGATCVRRAGEDSRTVEGVALPFGETLSTVPESSPARRTQVAPLNAALLMSTLRLNLEDFELVRAAILSLIHI